MQSGQIIRIGTSWLLAWIGAVSIALAQPAVSLGPDQTACGSAVLNAGNPGASYLWNTGDTTQTLTVTASGQYSVAVTDLNGTGRDTVVVTVLPVPSLQAADATVCGAQSLALSAQHSGNMLVWYGNSALTQFLGTGSPSVQPSASTDYYAQSYTTSFAGTAGIPNNTVYISGGFATIQTGYVFDALSTLIIDSVAVYVNVPNVTLRVDLWGSTNLLIDRRIVTVPATGKQFIDLAFFVPQGNNYKLMLTQITGGTIFRNGNTPYPYPFTLPGVVSIKRHTTTGNDNVTTFSSVFYDWHLSRIACASAVDTASVSVTAIPALVMPNDTIICDGSSFSIQPQNTAGAVNLWETGDTTLALTVTSSGTYSLQSYLAPQCAITDSIRVDFESTPVFSQMSDTVLCGPQALTLTAQHSGSVLAWYRNAAATQLIGSGAPTVQIGGDTAFYVRSFAAQPAGAAGILNDQQYVTGGFTTIQTGYVFDAVSSLVLDSVAVYVNAANTTLRIDLWGSTNALIERRIVTVPGTGKRFVKLGFYVPQGNDYKLMLTQITGGSIFRNGSAAYPYPFTLPGVLRIKRHTTTGNDNVTTFSSVFYDWRVSRAACASAVDTLSVSVVPVPSLVMPNDTILCDAASFTIQPQNTAGAVNLWETGDTTLTLTVTVPGTYSLQSYLAPQCAITDSIRVDFESTPIFSQLPDTVLCGPQALTLTAQHSGSVLAWYRNAAATQLIGSGAPTVQIGGDTAFYVRSFAAQPAGAAGILNDQQYVTGGFTTIQTGYVFDAVSSLVLDSVAVYVNAANTTLRIDLWGSTNALIERRIVTVPGTGKRFVKLGFYVPQGNDYKLMLTQITGGSIFRNGSAAYPYPFTLPGVLRIKRHTTDGSNTITAFSSVFYDWRVSRTACASAVDTLSVDIVPVPSLVMPNDTILCDAASFTIQPQNTAGAVNLWETGDTTLALTVTVPGTYSLQSYLAPQCAITDSIRVDFESTPVFSQLPDTVLCGPQALTLTAQHSGSVLAWYRNAAATQFIGSGAPTVQIGGDTAFYVRSFAAQPAGAAGILNDQQYVTGGFTTIQTGYVFDAVSSLVLDSVAVYVNAANTTLRIDLWSSTNALIERRIVTVPGTGKRFVKLGFYVPQGNDYKLMLTQITGGSIFRNGSAAYPYPFTLPGVLRIKRHTTTGNDNVTTFSSVFYDWRVSRTACVSAVDTLSVDIVPVPALVMPNDTILCDAASFTIQPQNTAGAVNLWETGDTTLTLTVTAPGTYSLQSYLNPQCPAFDSIRVEFEQIPQFAGLSDTVLCEPGFITLQAQHSGDVVAWYRDPAATQLISASTALVQPLADTAFYVRSYNTLSAGAVGIPDDQTFATGSFTSIQTGYVFDALTDLVIDSVAVYVSIASTELIIELWNAANVPIQRVVRKPGKLGKAFIPLTFLVPAGNDYKLMLRPVVTGSIYRNGNSPYPYPFALPGIIRIKRHTTDGSNTITTFSSVFYDWRVSRIACESPVETKGVQVSIPYVLPDSLYSCEPFTLSTQLPQFAYAWRPLTDAGPGPVISQSAAVQIDSSGLYLLRMEDAGGCVLEDTVEVDIPTTAGLPADGVLCGNFLTTNYGDEAEFLWSTGETASAIFIDTPGLYWVAVSEPRGCNLTDTIAVSGFSPFPDVNLGSDITACDSVLLDPQLPGNSYLWSTGSTAPALTVQSSGTYAVTVTNAFGCAASDTIGVFVLLTPSADLFYSVSGQLVSFSIDLNTLAGVLWIFGDGTSSNEFNPEHFYDAPGTYTVQLIVSNFCGSDTVTETVVIRSTTAVDPDAEAGLQVYPNPAQGQIQLETGLPAGTPYQLEVLDPLGRVLLATSGHAEPGARTLRLEPWPEGLYQLRLTARGQVSSRAFRLIR